MSKKKEEFDFENFDFSQSPESEPAEQSPEKEDFFESSPEGGGEFGQDFSQNSYNDSSSVNNLVDRKVVNLTADIPIQIVAVLGKKSTTVKEVVGLRMGQVVELGRLPNEAVDLVANGKLIAKGELVEVDGRLGVRILKIFD